MKRCPECRSIFPDTDYFCELDGTTLVTEDSYRNPVAGDRTEQEASAALALGLRDERRHQYWPALALLGVAAMAIGVVIFLVYQGLRLEAQNSTIEPSTNKDVTQQQILPAPLQSVVIASASPPAEPSPSPGALSSPAVQAESARAALSSSPVSTGGEVKTGRGDITIRLTNGTTVEADEVWETREGIWYRRRGVVTLLESDKVKAIERPIENPSPSASAVAPTSSPTASP